MKRLLLSVVLLAGCYKEPDGIPWTQDTVTSTACDLGNGVLVEADGPVFCGAVAANWAMAHDAIVPRFTTETEWVAMTANLSITVHTTERCLTDTSAGGGRGGCTYEETFLHGDSFTWAPAQLQTNEAGVQLTHEALHLVGAWNNDGLSYDHADWDSNGYYAVADDMATKAYRITP